MKKTFLPFLLFFIFFLIFENGDAVSQVLPPPGPGPSGGGGPASVPLDPISWILLASGGGLAAKNYYKKQKCKSKNFENE